MDLMPSMAEDFSHDRVWSEFLLDEWERPI